MWRTRGRLVTLNVPAVVLNRTVNLSGGRCRMILQPLGLLHTLRSPQLPPPPAVLASKANAAVRRRRSEAGLCNIVGKIRIDREREIGFPPL